MKRRNFFTAVTIFTASIFGHKIQAQQGSKMKRINDTLYDILDTNTGEYFTYRKVTTYMDGTPMDAGKCDGVIYRKLGVEYFKRNYSGSVKIEWFGAVGDGVTDDTSALQLAINTLFSMGGGIVELSAKVYKIVIVAQRSNVAIVGQGIGKTIIKSFSVANGKGSILAHSASAVNYVTNIAIRDLTIDGMVDSLGFAQFNYEVSWNGVKNGIIERVEFLGFRGDGIFLGPDPNPEFKTEAHNLNIIIRDCIFDGVNGDNRQGISILDCDGLLITGCEFKRSTRSDMPGCIDIEPDEVYNVCRNITIENNTFDTSSAGLGLIAIVMPLNYLAKPQNFIISNNTFKNNRSIYIVLSQDAVPGNLNLTITGNTAENVSSLVYLRDGKLSGAVVANNVVSGQIDYSLFGENAAITDVKNLIWANNIIRGGAGAVFFSKCENVNLNSNIFDGQTSLAVAFGADGQGYSNISITNNIFINQAGASIQNLAAAGLNNPSTLTLLGNTVNAGGVYFPAYINDNSGNSTNIFKTDVMPKDFPYGISTTPLENDPGTPVPNEAGTLKTFNLSSAVSRIHQEFVPVYNGAVRSKYIRSAGDAFNWGAWEHLSTI